MAQRLRMYTALAEDQSLLPRKPTFGSSQPAETPAPGDLTPSSGLHRHLHFYAHAYT